jgi:hypothetical protein
MSTNTQRYFSFTPANITTRVNLVLVIETTKQGVPKSGKMGREEFFKYNEEFIGALLKLQPRISTSDTRPDLFIDLNTVEQLQNILANNTNPLFKEQTAALRGLYTDISEFAINPEYNNLRTYSKEYFGFEVKGSEASVTGQSDVIRKFVQAYSFSKVGDESKREVKSVETYDIINKESALKGLLSKVESNYKERNLQIGNIDSTTNILRRVPRGLSGRSIIEQGDILNKTSSSSMVLSLQAQILDSIKSLTDEEKKNIGYSSKIYETFSGKIQELRKQIERKQGEKLSYLSKSRSKQVTGQNKATYLENITKIDKEIQSLRNRLDNELSSQSGRLIYNYYKSETRLENLLKAATKESVNLNDDPITAAIRNSPAMKQIRAKGELLFMNYVVNNKNYVAYLKGSFQYPNTKILLDETSIYFSYNDTYEKAVIVELLDNLEKSGDKALNKVFKDVDIASQLDTAAEIEKLNNKYIGRINLPKTKSIPIGKIKIPKTKISRKSTGSAFQSRIGSIRSILSETRTATRVKPSMGDFITDDTITALTKREMLRRMPIGPVGGPPKSSRVLTYRTGRFVNSLQVMVDMKSAIMQYYYDPNYWVHEATSRNPRNLIDSSLNSVTRALFGKRFNLIKANQGLD